MHYLLMNIVHKHEDELVDYLYTKNVLQSRSLELTLVVTRQCNLRCVYCGQAHESRKRMSEATYVFWKKMSDRCCCRLFFL